MKLIRLSSYLISYEETNKNTLIDFFFVNLGIQRRVTIQQVRLSAI